MPFEYSGFVNPYANSMADEIARSGDAQAHAAQIIGQAQARAAELKGAGWGRAIENIGNLPTQIAATQAAQTDRKLKEQQLSMTIEERQQVQAQRVATMTGRIFGVSRTPEEATAALDQAVTNGLLPPEIGQHVKTQLQTAGGDPTQFRALRQTYIDFADQFAAPVKLGKDETLGRTSVDPTKPFAPIASGVREPIKGAPGDQFFDQPATPGAPLQPIGSVPNRPVVVNGQVVQPDTATPIGAPIPKQETPSEVAERTARVTELQAQVKKIDAELAGTLPVSAADKLRLDLERTRIGNELEHWKAIETRTDPNSPQNQEKLENNYRGVVSRVLSSRSGGLGLEDQKVDQAKHLLALFDQNRDPKSGEYTLPHVLQMEAAMGLARLISPTGQPSEAQVKEINQRTAKGDVAGLVTYLTGTPVTGNTQAVFKMLHDSIERQGLVAEGNREHYLDSIRAFAPTDLSEDRRTRVEQGLTSLNRIGDASGGGHKVGDAVTYQGKSYRIKAITNGKAELEEAVTP